MSKKEIAEIICDDKTKEEQEVVADELERLNNTTVEEPAMFPNDFDKQEEEL